MPAKTPEARKPAAGPPRRAPCPVDIMDPAVVADPYPAYRLLREQAPVCWTTTGFWLVTRHADVSGLLRDPRCDHWGQDQEAAPRRHPLEAALAGALHLLSPEPPARLRRVVAAALASRDDVYAETARHADAILGALEGRTRIELMADYAHPLTFTMTCDLLGVPDADVAALAEMLAALAGNSLACLAPDRLDEQEGPPARAFQGYFRDLIERKRRTPGPDLASRLIDALSGAEDALDAHLLNLLVLLFHASHHNMMNFIGNAVLALAARPECLELARASPRLLRQAVPELLRFDSPVQYISLVARESIALRGEGIAPGEAIVLGVGAANRDPEVFAEPDRLDLSRRPKGQLAFGLGAYRCIGATLAELEGAAALSRLLHHFVEFRAANEPIGWRTSPFVQRGPVALPIEVGRHA